MRQKVNAPGDNHNKEDPANIAHAILYLRPKMFQVDRMNISEPKVTPAEEAPKFRISGQVSSQPSPIQHEPILDAFCFSALYATFR